MVQGGGEPEHTWNREWVKVWVSASRVQEEFKERKQSLPWLMLCPWSLPSALLVLAQLSHMFLLQLLSQPVSNTHKILLLTPQQQLRQDTFPSPLLPPQATALSVSESMILASCLHSLRMKCPSPRPRPALPPVPLTTPFPKESSGTFSLSLSTSTFLLAPVFPILKLIIISMSSFLVPGFLHPESWLTQSLLPHFPLATQPPWPDQRPVLAKSSGCCPVLMLLELSAALGTVGHPFLEVCSLPLGQCTLLISPRSSWPVLLWCYGLNVCVCHHHPPIHGETLTLLMMVLAGGPFERWLGQEGGALVMGISALINKGDPRECSCPPHLHHVRWSGNMAI